MFFWPVTVYYEDTDAGGVVYHSNYLNFFERARTEWLRSFGVKQTSLLAEDTAFVVSKAELDFIRPARFEQKLQIESTATDISRVSIVFNQRLLDDEGHCYCEGRITVVCVALSKMRPKAIPPFIAQELSKGAR